MHTQPSNAFSYRWSHLNLNTEQGLCGWDARMEQYCGKSGTVLGIDLRGAVQIRFRNDQKLAFSREALTVVDSLFAKGDAVRVEADVGVVKAAQDGHGGYNDSMAPYCGSVGRIVDVDGDGDCHIQFGSGESFLFNGALVTRAPGGMPRVDGDMKAGDIVRTLEDWAETVAAQVGKGGSPDSMRRYCGVEGRVVETNRSQAEVQFVDGETVHYSRLALTVVPGKRRIDSEYRVGDMVRVDADVDLVKVYQETGGGFVESMRQHCGQAGRVIRINGPAMRVQFAPGETYVKGGEVR